MKKYIKPIAAIVNLENECLLSNSGSDVYILNSGNGSDALSRGHRRERRGAGSWDDED